jgi:hypothetical protein
VLKEIGIVFDAPPDDLDDVIMGRMIKEAGMFYRVELDRLEET